MGKSILTKSIDGYEGLYEISSDGTIWSLNFNHHGERKPLKHLNSNGYSVVFLHKDGTQKLWRVHRLLGIAFLDNPRNKPQINHKNGVKTDNRLENLEWCTSSENHTHAYRVLGRKHNTQIGERHWNHKLTEQQVLEILSLRGQHTQTQLGRMFGVAQTTIATIQSGKSWFELQPTIKNR